MQVSLSSSDELASSMTSHHNLIACLYNICLKCLVHSNKLKIALVIHDTDGEFDRAADLAANMAAAERIDHGPLETSVVINNQIKYVNYKWTLY